jgi:hypothetical protein
MRDRYWAGALFLGSILFHLIPFLKSANPLGYDTGFYRRYLIEPFVSFPNPSVPGLGSDALVPRMLFDLLRLTHLPPEIILYGSYIFFFALLPVVLFYFLKPYIGIRGALFAGLLLILSPVQYEAFWEILWKNAFALPALFLTFIAIEREKLWWVLALDIVLALSHKTTAILYIATLILLFIVWEKRRKEMALHTLLTAVFVTVAALPALHTATLAVPVGIFLNWEDYFRFSAPFLFLIAFGGEAFRERKIPATLLAFTCVGFAFPIFHLPFYERIFLYTDIGLVAFAAYGADWLYQKIDGTFRAPSIVAVTALCIALGLFVGYEKNEINNRPPFFSASDIAHIEAIGKEVPPEALLLTNAAEAPWFEGWTHAHIAAPGMLRDTHNFDAWNTFWYATSTAERSAFLASFGPDLYIAALDNLDALTGPPPPCVKAVVPGLWKSECRVNE